MGVCPSHVSKCAIVLICMRGRLRGWVLATSRQQTQERDARDTHVAQLRQGVDLVSGGADALQAAVVASAPQSLGGSLSHRQRHVLRQAVEVPLQQSHQHQDAFCCLGC